MKSYKEASTEIWESKTEENIYGKKVLMFINRHTGLEETFVRVEKSIDKAWTFDGQPIPNEENFQRDPAESYGGNGFRRASWIERKLAEETNEDLDS